MATPHPFRIMSRNCGLTAGPMRPSGASHASPTPSARLPMAQCRVQITHSCRQRAIARSASSVAGGGGGAEQDIDHQEVWDAMGMPRCLHQSSSDLNENVQVLQFPAVGFPPEVAGARLLFLDHTGNVHSVYRPDQALTNAYWDEVAAVATLAPEGPLAVLGLIGGTLAHVIHCLAPGRTIHGWERDGAVVDVARTYLGLKDLEDSGSLVIHVGEAVPEWAAAGAEAEFSGIVVDHFLGASLHPELLKVGTWQSIAKNLQPGGRVVANLGGAPFPGEEESAGVQDALQALAAMRQVFGAADDLPVTHPLPDDMSYKFQMSSDAGSTLAITGPTPSSQDFESLPEDLRDCHNGWRPITDDPSAAVQRMKDEATATAKSAEQQAAAGADGSSFAGLNIVARGD